jgi:hypothetical protein
VVVSAVVVCMIMIDLPLVAALHLVCDLLFHVEQRPSLNDFESS